MSNLIFACWRDAKDALDETALRRIADRIAPPEGKGFPHHVFVDGKVSLCVTGPTGAAVWKGPSAHLGAFTGNWPEWHKPGSDVPEGTFALIRSDDARVELCSDFAGSRTLWYVLTENSLLASTSQRALVCLLEGFDLNRSALAWFLSSGSMGPADAWDKRITRLSRGGRLILNRAEWKTTLIEPPVDFTPRRMRKEQWRQDLSRLLKESLQGFDFTSRHWTLPLSGGYDCRFILATLFESGLRPQTMTWGLAASLGQPGNDAFIARRLAQHYGLPHQYLPTDILEETPERVVDNFLSASGGTTDELFPYLDGLRLWSSFTRQGVDGVIRGDEGFGWIPVISEQHARSSVGLVALMDFMDERTVDQISDGQQRVPKDLERREGETVAQYRDRLYHAYRIPVGLAALNDVKAPFVEIASPMLSRRVLEFIRGMPDELRTDKRLFKEIAVSISPPIPYATMGADDEKNSYLGSPTYSRWLEEELGTEVANALFPSHFRMSLVSVVRQGPSPLTLRPTLRATLKRVIPGAWVKWYRSHTRPIYPKPRVLALRAALICRMIRLLIEDSTVLETATKREGNG